MSYLTQARLAGDEHIARRVTACAASESVADPEAFAYVHRWRLSAQPGWVAAYMAAVAEDPDAPGAVESAVSDEMILTAVQSIQAGVSS